jgi:hypothetical protein
MICRFEGLLHAVKIGHVKVEFRDPLSPSSGVDVMNDVAMYLYPKYVVGV